MPINRLMEEIKTVKLLQLLGYGELRVVWIFSINRTIKCNQCCMLQYSNFGYLRPTCVLEVGGHSGPMCKSTWG